MANLTFFGNLIKDEHANSMVVTNMEEGILIPVQPKTTIVLVATTPSLVVATKNLMIDVKVQEPKAIVMEK